MYNRRVHNAALWDRTFR